jgi:hypothetical protein
MLALCRLYLLCGAPVSDGVSLPSQIGPYCNRILGLRVMPVSELVDNPRNWRKHPPAQEAGLDAVMRQVGVIDVVRFNEPRAHRTAEAPFPACVGSRPWMQKSTLANPKVDYSNVIQAEISPQKLKRLYPL